MKFALLFVVVVLIFLIVPRLIAGETIEPKDAAARLASGQAVLIDVREPAEWSNSGVAEPAVLLPLSDLRGDRAQWKSFLEKNRDKELILYCRSGNRSGMAARILNGEGFHATNVGGFRQWVAAGLPVRQVKEQ